MLVFRYSVNETSECFIERGYNTRMHKSFLRQVHAPAVFFDRCRDETRGEGNAVDPTSARQPTIERDYCNKRLPRLRFQKVFVEIEWANEPWRISQQRDSSGAHEARATRHFQNRNRKLYSGAFYFNPIPLRPPLFESNREFPRKLSSSTKRRAVFHSIRRRGLLKGVPSLLWNVSENFYRIPEEGASRHFYMRGKRQLEGYFKPRALNHFTRFN